LGVSFDASASTDPDGTIASYAWNFGDGTTGSGRTTSHTYSTVGTFSAQLTVTDNAGATANTTRSISATAPPSNVPPTASFVATPVSGPAPLTVSFDASASSDSDGSITTYAWNFGDSTTGTGKTASHTYSSTGIFTAQLTVTDNAGATAIITHDITVSASTGTAQWLGEYQSGLLGGAMLYAEITQSSSSLSGTFKDQEGRTGTINGTVAGTSVTLTIAETTPGCTGTFTGIGQLGFVRGLQSLDFTFTGTDCLGTHTAGEGLLIRQEGQVLAWAQRQPTSLKHNGGELFWTDNSAQPLKKLTLATGTTQALAIRMRALTQLTVEADRLLWVDAIGDSNAYCTGIGVQQALMVSARDGTSVRMLASGPACGGTVAPVSDGSYAYWVTSKTSTNAWSIERVPLAGGTSKVIYTASGFASIPSLARDSQHLYWIEDAAPDSGNVFRCQFSESCGVIRQSLFGSTSIDMATNLALTNDRIVFGAHRFGPPVDVIITLPKSGGPSSDIATAPDFPRVLVTDGSTVFWTDTSALRSAPLAGGTVTTLASSLPLSGGLSVDSQRVAWTELAGSTPLSARIRSIPKAGGSIEILISNAASPRVVELTGSSELIYADGVIDNLAASTSGIYRRSSAGVVSSLVTGISGSTAIAVNATHVYVADGWWVKRIPRAGGAAGVISQANFYIGGIDLDAAGVYWVETDLGTVRKAPLTGGAATLLASGNGKPYDITVNAGSVYWLVGLDKLLRVATTGGTVETLGTSLKAAEALVVDDSYAYFTESDAGRVSKIAFGGGAVTPIGDITGMLSWYALAGDVSRVFWLTPLSVGRTPKAGSTSTTLSAAPLSDDAVRGSVAVDDQYVYWAETLIGAIKRAPK
jgi:PKD repeat protein